MDNVTVPVPNDRTAEFYALYAIWLAAPANTMSIGRPPETTTPLAWSTERDGEIAVGTQLWTALAAAQQKLLDALAASTKIEAAQLAQALQLDGSIAVIQQAYTVNATAATLDRTPIALISVQANGVVLEFDDQARKVLRGGA